jgi:predicted nucleic acid-binding protein
VRVFFDINVVLDLLLDREPFVKHSAFLISEVERGNITGILSATSITTIYYLVSKVLSKKRAKKTIDILLSLFEIAPVNRTVLETARDLNYKDFEDTVIYACALHSKANVLVTRNIKDFKSKEIPVLEPEDLLKIIK